MLIPSSRMPARRAERRWGRCLERRRFIAVQDDLVVVYERRAGQIREHVTCSQEAPHDIDGERGVCREQVGQADPRMGLDVDEDKGGLLG